MEKSRRSSNDKTPFSLPKAPAAAGESAAAVTDSELMNDLVAATGRNDKAVLNKCFFDLRARHESFVLNVLRSENVPAHDQDSVAGRVWETIDRVARKPAGSRGAWEPGRGFGGGCPFVPFVRRIARSRARDYHDTVKTQRRRRRRLEAAVDAFGDDWNVHGGSPVKDTAPKKRGGNLKQTAAPAPWSVVAVGRTMLAAAMSELPERRRRALELHAEGLSNEEIAVVLETSTATVSRELNRARGAVRHLVEAVA